MIAMIIMMVVGAMVFAFKLTLFAAKAAWGMLKAVLIIIGLPVLLAGLVVAGLVYVAVPLLAIALLVIFITPALKTAP